MEVFYQTYLNNIYGMLLLDAIGFGLYFLIISCIYRHKAKKNPHR